VTSALSPDCLGEFRPDVASKWFVRYGLHSPYVIEAAAKRAAKLVERPLLSPMTRSPWEAMPGDRSIVWRLGGEPSMVVKVCATDDPTTAKMWSRSLDVAERLQPPESLAIPRVRLSSDQPVPWCVIDGGIGSPALLATARADELFNVVLAVQQTQIRGFQLRATWGASHYVRQVADPVRELTAAGVISPELGRRALECLETHRAGVRELPAVTAHNDLALYHIYTGGPVTWVIDWESVIRDRLHMLDVAHLIVNHGLARPEWAQELAAIALDHGRREFDCDLTSNLVLAQLERAAGKALDMLRRRHQQSVRAIEALNAVIEGRFLPD
jgi:hypothetical protein